MRSALHGATSAPETGVEPGQTDERRVQTCARHDPLLARLHVDVEVEGDNGCGCVRTRVGGRAGGRVSARWVELPLVGGLVNWGEGGGVCPWHG
jgi:hypothetical protein